MNYLHKLACLAYLRTVFADLMPYRANRIVLAAEKVYATNRGDVGSGL